MMKTPSILALVAVVLSSGAAAAKPIEPRTLTWNIVSDREMSRICRDHGLRPNCEGMAAWDGEFRMCVIWTRSPGGPSDGEGWAVVHHELQHCQEGHFHD
ncbi:MAG: hypothetical protein IPK66_07005 [Rhodospirillales bacterium]|nr:hypothetical protein [Rhodospirillales bacterium]